MAIVVESVTMTQNTTNTEDLVFDMPATRPDGDLYVVLVGLNGQITPSLSGWSVLYAELHIGALYGAAFYRFGSSEPATYTITHSSTQSRAVVLRISGSGTPVDTSDTGTGATAIAPAASPTPAGDSLIVRAWVIDDDDPGDNPPATHTTRDEGRTSASGGVYQAVATDNDLGDAGAATWGGTYSDQWIAATIEVPEPLIEVNLAGAQPAPSGALSLRAFINFAGAQPAASGVLASKQSPVALVGAQPAATGAFTSIQFGRLLAGIQPAPTGVLTPLQVSDFLFGAQPAPSGALSLHAFITLLGAQSAPSGALSVAYSVQLAGVQPSASGVLTVKLFVALAGAEPAPSGALSFRFLYPINQRFKRTLKRARIETTIQRGSR